MRNKTDIALTASAVFIADRIAKFFVLRNLAEGQSVKIFPGVFHVTFVLNDGIAFGLFKGKSVLFAMFSLAVILLIIIYTWKLKAVSPLLTIGLGLILGGAAGNLFDRFTTGYVVDFLDFRIWPIFNIADSAITVGVAMLAAKLCIRSSYK